MSISKTSRVISCTSTRPAIQVTTQKMKKLDQFLYADLQKIKKRKAIVPGSVTARQKPSKKKPNHVITIKNVVADLKYAVKNSPDPQVKKAAKAVLELMKSFAKKPPKTASAEDKKAVRALWWIFSNTALTAKEKRQRIINLINSEQFNNPVIRNAILIALASKWGIQLFTGKCRRVPNRSYDKLVWIVPQRKCKIESLHVGQGCIAWEPQPAGQWRKVRVVMRSRTICSFKNTYDLKVINRIAKGTRVSPVEHSAYLSLNKRVAQYIKASVEHIRREAKKKAFFERAMARIRKKKYAKRTTRYCKRRPRRCVTLKLGGRKVQVKKRSRVYRDLVKSGYIKIR